MVDQYISPRRGGLGTGTIPGENEVPLGDGTGKYQPQGLNLENVPTDENDKLILTGIVVSATAPTSPFINQLWLDIS